MALIKGMKFPPAGDDPESKGDDKSQKEEQVRKGGLIKGAAYRSKYKDVPGGTSFPELPEVPHQKRGKVLKSWDAQVLKLAEEVAAETGMVDESLPDLPDQGDPGDFVPASFMSQPGGSIPGPRNVVMIPSGNKAPSPGSGSEAVTRKLAPEEEFKVIEEVSLPPVPNVDVEAMVAEAERRGQEQAGKIIEHAQEEAKKLIDQAKIYGETSKQEAHQEGFKLGKEDGYKAGLEEFQAMMGEAKNLLNQIIQERNRILETAEPELAKLSIGIAEKIIGDELKANPDVIISVVKQAMTKLKSRERVTVKVNPEELEHAKSNRDIFASLVEGLKELEIIGDPRVDKGGCLIETNMGNTDARLSTQLEAIRLAFHNLETGTYI